ncbi:MAG TPA: carboxypeptidase-like regulatory domain-containing protein, partial [Terracidiphilus sp.]|nr:carboxypeptidase-like regulatory domain-containing protein [Terracidiphilus sp.]
MHFINKLCVALLALYAPAAAQQAPPAPATISGTVIQEVSSQGLRKVIVSLTGQNPDKRQDYATATDPLGQFRIEGVLPGEYEVAILRPGFVRVNSRAEKNRITITAGQDLTGLVYKMQSAGVVSGKITEADGDPVAGVTVWVTRAGKNGEPAGVVGGSN